MPTCTYSSEVLHATGYATVESSDNTSELYITYDAARGAIPFRYYVYNRKTLAKVYKSFHAPTFLTLEGIISRLPL
jgi:hypothetical protein